MVTFSTSFTSFRNWIREFLAEFTGTFILVFIGNNSVAQKILTDGQGGNNLTVFIGYSFGLFLGVAVASGVSGAHLNPAVTVANAVVKKSQWRKVPHYLTAQYLGAFIAACGTYVIYADSFQSYHSAHGINKTTAAIFATYPKEHLTVAGSFIDQILGTMILLLGIYATTDPFNQVPHYLTPIYVALTLLSIGCSLGINQGFALNPARDLSPRLFTYITSWGSNVFGSDTYWYVTIIGPHVGAVLGAWIYVFLIERMRSKSELKSQSTILSELVKPKKSNRCFTKCAFIDVDAALKEKKLRKNRIQKLESKESNLRKNEPTPYDPSVSHI